MTQFTSAFGEVFIVADGMGGHLGGAAAATAVVCGMQAHLTAMPLGMPLAEALCESCRRVNAEVYQQGSSGDQAVAGMGSTMVVAVLAGSDLVIASVGDSRAYLFRDYRLRQLTRDHTRVQQYVDAKMMGEAEARNHPDASVLTRAIGQKLEVELDILPPLPLRRGDGVLLCSDGLSGYIEDPAIEDALRRNRSDPQTAVDALVLLALEAGGEDNVTVQFVLPEGQLPAALPLPNPPAAAAPRLRWVNLVILFFIVLGVVATLTLPRIRHQPAANKPTAPTPVKPLILPKSPPAAGPSPPHPADPAQPAATNRGPIKELGAKGRGPRIAAGTRHEAAGLPAQPVTPQVYEPSAAVSAPAGEAPTVDTPRLIVLYGKNRDAAAQLKEEITDFLGGPTPTISVVEAPRGTDLVQNVTSVHFNKAKPHRSTAYKIAAQFRWEARDFSRAETRLFPSADIVVVVGAKETER